MSPNPYNKHFNDFFLEEGGLLAVGFGSVDYPADFSLYSNIICAQLPLWINNGATPIRSIRPRTIFGYVNNPELNAAAALNPYDEAGNSYFIGINAGVVYLLERLFYTMLANSNVLAQVGDATREQVREKLDKAFFTDVRNFGGNGLQIDYPVPFDPTRKAAARLLTYLALMFLSQHELTHILNGHVDYVRKFANMRLIQESRLSEEQRMEYLLSQTIEFDADAIGICSVVDSVFWQVQHPESLPLEFQAFVPDRASLIGMMVFAAYSVFKIFGDDPSPDKSLLEEYYPPFEMRRKLLINTVFHQATVKQSRGRFDRAALDEMHAQIINGVQEVEIAFSHIDTESPPFTKARLAEYGVLTPSELAHMVVLKEHFEQLRPELERYAYRQLYKPD